MGAYGRRARPPCYRRPARARLLPRRPRADGNLLLDGDRFAITDFDGARTGDPHRDLAIWLAALTFDVPALDGAVTAGDDAAIERAEAAYLDGYGPHDERRLLWHRAAAEVHYVAVALKKDRHEPSRAQRGLRIAQHCAEALG